MKITDVATVTSDAVVVETVAALTRALKAGLRVCADVLAIIAVTTPPACYNIGVRYINTCQYDSGMIQKSLLQHICQCNDIS